MSISIKLSIVTICLNAENYIEKTILSVIPFLTKQVEYFIIDGGSTDGTTKIIDKYKSKITKWISKKDKGIYDAMNKGILLCNGEWIVLLNAGDVFIRNPLEIFEYINDQAIDVCYGDAFMQMLIGRLKRMKILKDIHISQFYRFPFCHQTVFVKRALYQKLGIYNISYKIAGDYELLLRFAINGIKFKHVSLPFVIMDGTGVSNRQWQTPIHEMKNALITYGLYKNLLRLMFDVQSIKSIIYFFLSRSISTGIKLLNLKLLSSS